MPGYREQLSIGYLSDYSEEESDTQEKEKQISVDPVSLRQANNLQSAGGPARPPPVLLRPKLVSCSLPGSAFSSPVRSPNKPEQQQRDYYRSRFAWESNASLRRSKSCCEGRMSTASAEFIDIASRRPSIASPKKQSFGDVAGSRRFANEANHDGNSFKQPKPAIPLPPSSNQGVSTVDKFKCGCLFLPGLTHKKKPAVLDRKSSAFGQHLDDRSQSQRRQQREEEIVRTKIEEPMLQLDKARSLESSVQETAGGAARPSSRMSTASKAASLEKFSCGSWSSSALLGSEGSDGRNSYFDLPLELIRSGGDETESPVRTAFVFEKELVKRGSLRKAGSARKSSLQLNRHVRFSTSSGAVSSCPPSPAAAACITPRLRKAREEFNAFLAAHDA